MSAQTLLLTLRGPQQAWGSRSRFATRGTERAPTRSGVIGLIAAAMGLERTDPLDRFDGIRFGVRVDRPGRIESDFQTARTLDGKTSMPLSHRAYLADAVFVAGLESADNMLLKELRDAVRRPAYPLYLGRRAFPPAGPIPTDLVELPLLDTLRTLPWQAPARSRHQPPPALDVLIDAEPGEAVDLSLEDVPISFDPRRRRYTWRDVRFLSIPTPGADASGSRPDGSDSPAPVVVPAHDPMLLVSEEEV